MKLVTIKESHSPSDLYVLQSRLESEGIKCYLKNELTTQIMNHIGAFVVELQVSMDDIGRVQEILKELEE